MQHHRRYSVRFVALILVAFGLMVGPPGPTRAEPPTEPLPAHLIAETITRVDGFIVALAFAPDGRLFFTLKGGFGGDAEADVRVWANGALQPEPWLRTPVATDGERGLLGIAFDPNFTENRYLYIYKTAPASETGTGRPANRVVRYTEDPATHRAIPESATLIFEIPIGPENDPSTYHNGGNIHFGPDGKLYVTVGDGGQIAANGQNLNSLMGKIHRLDPDGTAPPDNPFVPHPEIHLKSIWTYGHRNSFDFVFDPISGQMFFTENGPNCDDEVNVGFPGSNYGWPNECGTVSPGTVSPLYRFLTPIGITGIDVYQGPITPWNSGLFWCSINTGALYHATLDPTRTAITEVRVVTGAPPCGTDVQHGPDGALYLAGTSTISRIRPAGATLYLPLVGRGWLPQTSAERASTGSVEVRPARYR